MNGTSAIEKELDSNTFEILFVLFAFQNAISPEVCGRGSSVSQNRTPVVAPGRQGRVAGCTGAGPDMPSF